MFDIERFNCKKTGVVLDIKVRKEQTGFQKGKGGNIGSWGFYVRVRLATSRAQTFCRRSGKNPNAKQSLEV